MNSKAEPYSYKLVRQDCLKGMRKIDPDTIDIVITSPPYNLGIAYGNYKDSSDRSQYLSWCIEWAREIKRILKENGSFFLNIGASPSNPMLPHEIAILMSQFFVLQNTFHWIKSITVETPDGNETSVGHFKPINSKRYVTDCHEYVFHLTHAGNTPVDRLSLGVPYSDKSNIARWSHTGGRDKRCRGNNWFVSYKTIQSRAKDRPHPATFPVKLAENCIKLHGVNRSTVVLDPFVGIGHAPLGAIKCGVKKFIGFDINPYYLKTAREQIKQFKRNDQKMAKAV